MPFDNEYSWCEDERAKIYGIYPKGSSVGTYTTGDVCDGFLGDILKDIAQMDSGIEARKFIWNEVVYQEIDYEPLYALVSVPSATSETVEPSEENTVSEKDKQDDAQEMQETHDDLTYQGLVKNHFMYT